MKKLLIIGLLSLVLISPLPSYAQTVSQEELNAQLMQLINSLMVQVQDLMKQLITMQAQQIEDSQKITTIQQQVASSSPQFGGQTPSVPSGPTESDIQNMVKQIKDCKRVGCISYIYINSDLSEEDFNEIKYVTTEASAWRIDNFCSGNTMSKGIYKHNTTSIVKSARANDPVLDSACKQLGY